MCFSSQASVSGYVWPREGVLQFWVWKPVCKQLVVRAGSADHTATHFGLLTFTSKLTLAVLPTLTGFSLILGMSKQITPLFGHKPSNLIQNFLVIFFWVLCWLTTDLAVLWSGLDNILGFSSGSWWAIQEGKVLLSFLPPLSQRMC